MLFFQTEIQVSGAYMSTVLVLFQFQRQRSNGRKEECEQAMMEHGQLYTVHIYSLDRIHWKARTGRHRTLALVVTSS
jgi:hypothetical protein